VRRPPTEFWKCSSAKIDTLSKPDISNTLCRDINVTSTMQDALSSPFAGYWYEAVMKEYQNMIDFQTFRTVNRTTNMKPIKSKWVFTVKPKKDSSGLVEKFKARLVAKGFSQRFGVDYNETFAPVAHQESLRTLLALSTLHELQLRQLDVVGAYLNGDIDEELYMCQPEGFNSDNSKVWRLNKAIYGLKQAGCVWNKKLNISLVTELGFKRCISDPCIYILRDVEKIVIMAVYVDDMILAHNDNNLCERVVAQLDDKFQITDLGEPTRILGMNLQYHPDKGTISINQSTYIKELMTQFNLTSCKPISTPHQPGVYLTKAMEPSNDEERQRMRDTPYGSLVGALNYISTHTRPDISTAVGALCRYISNPGPAHWTAAKRVLQYLSYTLDMGIIFTKGESKGILAYSDSDWGQDIDTRRSTTGYVITLAGAPISWKSKRQSTVATSSVHAEYMALYDTIREVVWLRTLLQEMGFPESGPTKVYGDNQGCLAICSNLRTDSRTKHIDIKYHFNREQVQGGMIDLEYCPTGGMVADSLTKPTNISKYLWCRHAMGLRDVQLRGSVEGTIDTALDDALPAARVHVDSSSTPHPISSR
jgi:Reverse transcriptase (RNA-dependent DNA polymerase)